MTTVTVVRWPSRQSVHRGARTSQNALPPWGLPEWFLIAQIVLPALLFLPGSQAFRLPIRISAFSISLFALGWWYTTAQKRLPHRAWPWLIASLAYLALMIVHPTTNSFLAGFAQTMLYLSVLAPVFWLPGLIRDHQHLQRLLAILLVCNGINSIVGILQVYDPVRWLPQEFSSIVMAGPYGLNSVSYIGSDGQRIIRPPGLFDSPGAVAGPGMYAGLLGLIFYVRVTTVWQKAISLCFAFAGTVSIYLAQVRTSILILAGMVLVFGGLLFIRKQKAKGIAFLTLAGVLGFAAFIYASSLGGQSISDRFSTLFADQPITVYYDSHRGSQLEHALTHLLVDYPLGAGLGRWGMMRYYFGDAFNFNSPPIWAELQIPAWILDGGAVLLVLYSCALWVTAREEMRQTRMATDTEVQFWGCAVIAANAGILALIFGFTPFTTQIGLQYWFLVASLHGAMHGRQRRP